MVWGLGIKMFNVMGVHSKIQFLRKFTKKNNILGGLLKLEGLDSLQI